MTGSNSETSTVSFSQSINMTQLWKNNQQAKAKWSLPALSSFTKDHAACDSLLQSTDAQQVCGSSLAKVKFKKNIWRNIWKKLYILQFTLAWMTSMPSVLHTPTSSLNLPCRGIFLGVQSKNAVLSARLLVHRAPADREIYEFVELKLLLCCTSKTAFRRSLSRTIKSHSYYWPGFLYANCTQTKEVVSQYLSIETFQSG